MKVSRREFIKGVAAAGALACAGRLIGGRRAFSAGEKSRIFRVDDCPLPDGRMEHKGVDTLLDLLADHQINFYQTASSHPWGGPEGIIAVDDVVIIKVNCQWKCRGTTNTDVLQGLIYRILQHPDGFNGEVVIFENGQGRGGFDGLTQGGSAYSSWQEIEDEIFVNAEDENQLTVDYLVQTVFKNDPVSSYLLDAVRSIFIDNSDHISDGYRRIADVSYPCFTSSAGNRIELREGIWNGSGFSSNLKFINMPVFKHHGGTGITGTLKNTYGILSMSDGQSGIRHYSQSGTQCGKMYSLVRAPDLNVLDCIWVSPDSLRGYPEQTTYRADVLLAGVDPVALDYHASKEILLPLGGSHADEHDPDHFSGLINHLEGARDAINDNGGIEGEPARMGDENIEVIAASAANTAGKSDSGTQDNSSSGGGGGCFIGTSMRVY
jgi:uncharacterized protein (DUF362 family)